ncbi:MAG: MFS transporter [Acidobacteriota bacterium]|nr:MFS transporter [Acidobacteriota bacterium]
MSDPPGSSLREKRWLSRGVLGIGLASLFSDWGHETATAILPAFLTVLGAPAFALGVIEGLSDGLSSFAKLAGGWVADDPERRKPTGIIGYTTTAITTFVYSFAQSWPVLLALRSVGWMGRGSRGPSRDSLLADSVDPGRAGRAFGFERAMDSLGAVLGPLSALALLGRVSERGILRWTLLPGMTAALCFAFMAPAGKRFEGQHAPSIRASFTQLPRPFWYFLAGVFTHGVGDFAPTLLILRATQILTPRFGTAMATTISITLYLLHNVVNSAASYPAGALGDRLGKRGLLALGYLVAAAAYAGFIFERPTLAALAVLFALAGVHGGFQDSLEKSLAAEVLPRANRGSGFGVLAASNGLGDVVSSMVVGALWTAVSPAAGFAYAAVFTGLGAVLILWLRGNGRPAEAAEGLRA